MTFSFGVVKFTECGRNQLAAAFTTISYILGFLCGTLILNTVYITFTIAPTLYSEKAIIKLVYSIIGMLSTQLAIYYISGIYVCRKCHNEAYKKNSRYLLRIWIISGYSNIINIILIAFMASGCSNHIIRSMHHSMIRGMRKYLKDISWKQIIDVMQYNLQCCGSTEYTDWHKVPWLSTWHIISSKHLKNYKKNGDRLFVTGVPWSCCKLDYDKQCFHDPIQQYQYLSNWEKLHRESVNNVGCIEMLREPIEYSFLYFICMTYVIFILQIILTIVSRYLYTANKNAIILGDPFGTSPGWIISHRTASEIMDECRRSTTTCPKSRRSMSSITATIYKCRARSCPRTRSRNTSPCNMRIYDKHGR